MRFLFLADMQLGCYATFSGMTPEEIQNFARRGMQVEPVPAVEGFEWDARRFERAIEVANELLVDAVVIGGDMVDDLGNDDQIAEFFRIAGGLDDRIPLHLAAGNHDVAADTVTPTQESIAQYRATFGADFYSVEYDEVTLVTINTTVAQRPELVPKDWEQQLAFLEEALTNAPEGRPVILVGHHPWFVERADEPDSYWNIPGERRQTLLALAERHEVRLALAGHWHRNALGRHGALEMVTSGPVGYPLGDDPSGYRVVDVSDGVITHRYHPLPG